MPNDYDVWFLDLMRQRARYAEQDPAYAPLERTQFLRLMANFDLIEEALIRARATVVRLEGRRKSAQDDVDSDDWGGPTMEDLQRIESLRTLEEEEKDVVEGEETPGDRARGSVPDPGGSGVPEVPD